MVKYMKRKIVLLGVMAGAAALLFSGCGGSQGPSDTGVKGDKKTVHLSYVEWDTEVASTNVLAKVLGNLGYKVELTPLDNAVMWQAVATGKSDGMTSAWLPATHQAQYAKYGKDVTDLGANLTGARIGLVVPDYMSVSSIEDLSSQAGKAITGIEPGAGVTMKTEKALQEYPNLKGWKLNTSSSGAMAAALKKAVDNQEEIVITGWSPHWMFAAYPLKYLDDPKGVFGGEEEIHTIVRKGLEKDMPDVYKVMDRFQWTVDDINSVMLDISKGMKPEQAAEKWLGTHPDKVKAWTEGIPRV